MKTTGSDIHYDGVYCD